MNRFEYANSVRDLLGLEIDPASFLPADDSSHGFDNMAEVLNLSPTLMEGYIKAAGRISRLAEIRLRHPWIVLNVLQAFERANDIAERERLEHAQSHIATGLVAADALRTPLVRHGVKANRLVLETAAQYSQEQGFTPRRVRLEELFAASALDQ